MFLRDSRIYHYDRRRIGTWWFDPVLVDELPFVFTCEVFSARVGRRRDPVHVRCELGDVQQHLARKPCEMDVALCAMERDRIWSVVGAHACEGLDDAANS